MEIDCRTIPQVAERTKDLEPTRPITVIRQQLGDGVNFRIITIANACTGSSEELFYTSPAGGFPDFYDDWLFGITLENSVAIAQAQHRAAKAFTKEMEDQLWADYYATRGWETSNAADGYPFK